MKVIIAGATGFIGKQLTFRALQDPAITSIIALGRRPFETESGAETSKLINVVLDDFSNYPVHAKAQLADADGCIWCIASTPRSCANMTLEDARITGFEHLFTGLDAILSSRTNPTPLRFLYISGSMVTRGPDPKVPDFVPEAFRPFFIMRCEIETALMSYKDKHTDSLDVCVARPGRVIKAGKNLDVQQGSIEVDVLAAALVDQAVNGFEKDPVENAELAEIGRRILQKAAA